VRALLRRQDRLTAVRTDVGGAIDVLVVRGYLGVVHRLS
jgi:hypothetical protein